MSVHVVVGGGHFIERGGRMFQELVARAPDVMPMFVSAIERISGSLGHSPVGSGLIGRAAPIPASTGDRATIRLVADTESSAWDKFSDSLSDHTKEGLKELGLSAGCAGAGDLQGALEHGLNATLECGQAIWEGMLGTLQRPGDGR